MAERQFGPYRLVRQVAVGGMAEIHLAKTKGIAGFEKYVAIKMIHPNFAEDDQFIQMLVDEAKIAVHLTHGNIAQTFDLGRVGETYYITMEFVDGSDLYKILRRGSEQDLEMPLDVCAFIGKEVASALDYAHRKRDHTGRSLGIVHRDVSPQNVLVSYAGEVKLVDFGIAKATMKVRQTAAGVIKGKYYYMSPEQAWGDPIDSRSDIFSAGIVLYEMITGQMLYLEEDLHKLLDMARRADIAPPSTLRRSVPPQLERIVMHALQKAPDERYQSAADFASDLERFLHAYSPVFTANKLSTHLRQAVGDPIEVAHEPEIEVRDGPMSTHALGDDDLMHAREEFQDENSVIFRVNELKQEARRPAVTPAKPVPRVTRVSEVVPTVPPIPVPRSIPAAPSIPRAAKPTRPAKPRQPEDETRELEHAPANPHQEESGLLAAEPPKPWSDHIETDELEGIAERTVVSAPPMSFMDSSADDGIDATLITQPPQHDTDVHDTEPELEPDDDNDNDDDEGPTLARSGFGPPKRTPTKPVAPPPALSAKIHSPAVSELRKPRPSRRTPPGGTPTQSSVLQAIVGAQVNEPMPAPRAHAPTQPQQAQPQPPAMPLPAPQSQALPYPGFPTGTMAMNGAGYSNDASGLPLGVPTPPSGVPAPQPYPFQSYPQYPQYPTYNEHHMTPGALYQMQPPYGAPPPNPMTLTGQLRLSEGDEIPAQYRLDGGSKRWFVYILAGTFAVTIAATVTFFIIRSMRDTPAVTTASIHVDSTPTGATVYYDGQKLPEKTPMKIDEVPVSTKHQIRLELDHYRPVTQDADVSSSGNEVRVLALLDRIRGKIRLDSQPTGAEIRLNDRVRGHTPATLSDIDMESAKTLELRLKDYQPYIQQLDWPTAGEITISKKLERSK